MDKKKGIRISSFGKTWIIVAGIVILTGILLILSVNSTNLINNNPSSSTKTEKNVAHTSLEFASEPRIASPSGTYEIDLNINTGSDKVNLTQLEMSYNPKQLTRVDIKPGTFINNPVVIQKNVDAENGRIKFWLGTNPNQTGSSGNGTLATISFVKIGSGSAKIIFLPKTSVNADGSSESVLKNMTPAIIGTLPVPTRAIVIKNPNRFTLPTRIISPTPPRTQPISPMP